MFGSLRWLVPLLFLAVYLQDGIRRLGGWAKRSASTRTRAHGTPTPATGTTAGCNLPFTLGAVSAVPRVLILQPLGSSFTVRTSCGAETVTLGVNGELPDSAGSSLL